MTLQVTRRPSARPPGRPPAPPSRGHEPAGTRLVSVSEPAAPPLTDPGSLLELAASGDLQAFGRFYDLMSPRVYGLALRVLRDPGYACLLYTSDAADE